MIPWNKNRADYIIFTNGHDGSQSLHNMNKLRDKVGTFCHFTHQCGCYEKHPKSKSAACIHHKTDKTREMC